MTSESIKVPDLGGASQVEVIEICVSIGEAITEGQSIVVVESDKASMDIPSPLAGVVESIAVVEGSSVGEGDLLLSLAASDSVAKELEPQQENSADTAANLTGSADESPISSLEAVQAAGAAPSVEASETIVVVPDLGGADSVEVIEVLVAAGDSVQEGDGLIVVESDKASMDIPSNVSGKVVEVIVAVGATVTAGDPLLRVLGGAASQSGQVTTSKTEQSVDKSPTQHAPANETVQASDTSQPSAVRNEKTASTQTAARVEQPAAPNISDDGVVYAGPAVRKLARELGVDLAKVKATGPKGRVAKQDLHEYVKQLAKGGAGAVAGGGMGLPPVPEVDFSQFGEIDIQPMTKMHKLTAANMQRSWLNVPHVTQYDDADITELEQFRNNLKPEMERRGIKVSPLAFIVKAVATALRAHPIFNSSLSADGQSVVYKKFVNIGMAVDTPAGLLVPVIRDADHKGIWELAEEITQLAALAKERKLKPADMQGGCFTVSSLGNIGGRGFTPIINTPEVGILGVSKLATQPVFINGEFVPRQLLPLALSYDHRAVNGGDAGRFMTDIVAMLSDLRLQLM